MRVRQPRVQRPDGELDGKSGQEHKEDGVQAKEGDTQCVLLSCKRHRAHVKRADGESQRKDAHQHEGASEQRIEDEFHRGILAVAGAPHRNEEIHGHQLHFPEQEEEKKVTCDEHALHTGQQQKQPDVVLADALLDVP